MCRLRQLTSSTPISNRDSRRLGSRRSAMTRVRIRPTVSQSMCTSRQIVVLSAVVAKNPTRSSKSRVKREPDRAKGTPSGAHPVGRAVQPAQPGAHLQAPHLQVQVPPGRVHRAGVVSRPGRVAAVGADQARPAQGDSDRHPVGLEGDLTHPDAGQMQEARECSGDTHGRPSLVRLALSSFEPAASCVSPTRGNDGWTSTRTT